MRPHGPLPFLKTSRILTMSEFLTQAQALKAEAAQLRADPIADERRRDEAYSRAAELERQAYVEEVLHDLSRQPSIEPTPVLDRRSRQVQAAQAAVKDAQQAVDQAQEQIGQTQRALLDLGRSLPNVEQQEAEARDLVIELQQAVADLEDHEASFFLGRLFRIARYQEAVAEREAAQQALIEAEDLVGDLRNDIQALDDRQNAMLDRLVQDQAVLTRAQHALDRTRERLDDVQITWQEARREEMERRWNALPPDEQIRRIDERRLHERLVNERLNETSGG